MAPKTNAQRQADYRARLKRAAKVPPGDLEALAEKAGAVVRATASLKPFVEAMPRGEGRDRTFTHIEELQTVGHLLRKLERSLDEKDAKDQ